MPVNCTSNGLDLAELLWVIRSVLDELATVGENRIERASDFPGAIVNELVLKMLKSLEGTENNNSK
jgi:hypothetical protein